jgi:hypothetical protein
MDRNSIIKTFKIQKNEHILDKIIVDKEERVILKKSLIPVSQLKPHLFSKDYIISEI